MLVDRRSRDWSDYIGLLSPPPTAYRLPPAIWLAGEYYDLPSDRLNTGAGPLTGGSKVLVTGDVSPRQCLALAYASLVTALSILLGTLPRSSWPLGMALVIIAHQYSSPPFKLNHRGVGEVVAALATNVLLPPFAVLAQQHSASAWEGPASLCERLAILVVPAFLVKVALFLELNMADRRPDWLGGKYTLAVLLGDEASARWASREAVWCLWRDLRACACQGSGLCWWMEGWRCVRPGKRRRAQHAPIVAVASGPFRWCLVHGCSTVSVCPPSATELPPEGFRG